ncbi:MAG: hypothetical protein JWN04_1297 [Myxococcaceae bacterium]|nr:hypothetical protein [Myxococcaceae bacterium]
MKKWMAPALCAAALMAFSAAAGSVLAQDEAKPAAAGAAATGATAYDFDDDLVTGDLVRPDGELLSVRRRGNRASLIQIREHFIPEMLKSVEDL